MRGVALDEELDSSGDKQAGSRVAAILSIAETCKRQGLPRATTSSPSPGMPTATQRSSQLTPIRWKQSRA